MRNQKGITLIALVITIIVLLILAGVSIAMLTGENGLLNRANNAKKATVEAEAVERINLTLNAIKAEIYAEQVSDDTWAPVTTTDGTSTAKESIGKVLTNDGFTVGATDGYGYTVAADKITLTYNNATLEISGITGSITVASPYTIDAAEVLTK